MSEYVKTEDVLSKLYLDHKDVTYIDKNAAADRIKKIQGIDIVRCQDCKHEDDCEHEVLLSEMWGEIEETAHITYCSYGERRSDE